MLFSVFLFSSSSVATEPLTAIKEPVDFGESPLWGLILRPGVMGGASNDFFVDFMIPAYIRQDRVVILNFALNYNIDSDRGNSKVDEENFGIVYRRLVKNDSLILGFNTFFDTRQTEYDNRFNQVGVGFEAMSQWFDFRANYYYPLSDEVLVPELNSQTNLGIEEPLTGWDAEVAALVPGISDYMETRISGGFYHYYSDYFENISGRKVALEIRPNTFFTFRAEYNDDLSTYLGGYLTIPIPFPGSSFTIFKMYKTLHAGQSVRDLRLRMYDKVQRDRYVRTQVGAAGPEIEVVDEGGDLCVSNADCDAGELCDAGSGACVDDGLCEVHTDCSAGEVCNAGVCVDDGLCKSDADCAGELCMEDGRCVPLPL